MSCLFRVCCASCMLLTLADKAEEMWTLFPAGQVPGERPGWCGPEKLEPISSDKDNQYKDVSVPTLVPFLAPGGSNTSLGTAVVVAPGGGYGIVAWNREGTDIASWLNSIGVSAFVLKYRVPARPWLPFGEAPLMDAQRAVRMVRANAERLGLNESRIGFMGFSAGGHLTAHVSTEFQRQTYTPLDEIDRLSSRPDFSILVYPWRLVEDNDLQKVALNVTGAHPPAMLVQAWDDPEAHVQNSLQYTLALKSVVAPPSELHMYPKGGHGYGRCTVTPGAWNEVCTWPDRAARFLAGLGVIGEENMFSSEAEETDEKEHLI
eukprot:TRINITY_DN101486_c0_g1_i1.p1 TRINITY_DN101486_c0_g1~~TRINITY_DN101486_c0_g1_i1.p1  ORF type:complete len:346 (-),score=46.07 TRINITY_DN101486_c0_g1_i1:43-999(-)